MSEPSNPPSPASPTCSADQEATVPGERTPRLEEAIRCAPAQGHGGTLRNGDLRGWTVVDVLPVVVCKQGSEIRVPLAPIGARDTAKVGSHGRQRDPGSPIFLSSRLSSSRPPRLGRPSEPSLRDGIASPDLRPLTRKFRLRLRRGNQAPELGRDHDVAITVTSMNGGQ